MTVKGIPLESILKFRLNPNPLSGLLPEVPPNGDIPVTSPIQREDLLIQLRLGVNIDDSGINDIDPGVIYTLRGERLQAITREDIDEANKRGYLIVKYQHSSVKNSYLFSIS